MKVEREGKRMRVWSTVSNVDKGHSKSRIENNPDYLAT